MAGNICADILASRSSFDDFQPDTSLIVAVRCVGRLLPCPENVSCTPDDSNSLPLGQCLVGSSGIDDAGPRRRIPAMMTSDWSCRALNQFLCIFLR